LNPQQWTRQRKEAQGGDTKDQIGTRKKRAKVYGIHPSVLTPPAKPDRNLKQENRRKERDSDGGFNENLGDHRKEEKGCCSGASAAVLIRGQNWDRPKEGVGEPKLSFKGRGKGRRGHHYRNSSPRM